MAEANRKGAKPTKTFYQHILMVILYIHLKKWELSPSNKGVDWWKCGSRNRIEPVQHRGLRLLTFAKNTISQEILSSKLQNTVHAFFVAIIIKIYCKLNHVHWNDSSIIRWKNVYLTGYPCVCTPRKPSKRRRRRPWSTSTAGAGRT